MEIKRLGSVASGLSSACLPLSFTTTKVCAFEFFDTKISCDGKAVQVFII